MPHGSSKRSTIAVRLKQRERIAVENAARRAGIKLSAWVRRVIVEATGKEEIEKKSSRLLAG
jgi:hypothetical protein